MGAMCLCCVLLRGALTSIDIVCMYLRCYLKVAQLLFMVVPVGFFQHLAFFGSLFVCGLTIFSN